jgi:glycosyltransferase involved in cell wall biosynthesis
MKIDYIVTIHNSGDILPRVLQGIINAKQNPGAILCMVDGCTDNCGAIVTGFAHEYSGYDIRRIDLPNVYEIRAINAGLAEIAAAEIPDYIVTVQDDVILQEPNLETIIPKLYYQFPRLGYLTFRAAMNLETITESPWLKEIDVVESEPHFIRAPGAHTRMSVGCLVLRMAACKSAACIPGWLFNHIGFIPEWLYPAGCDDFYYSLSALTLDCYNGAYAAPLETRLEWGGVRRFDSYDWTIEDRNKKLLRDKFTDVIENYRIPDMMKDIKWLNTL